MALLHLYFVLCPNRLETGIQNEMIGGNSDFFRYSFVLSGEVVSPLSYGAGKVTSASVLLKLPTTAIASPVIPLR